MSTKVKKAKEKAKDWPPIRKHTKITSYVFDATSYTVEMHLICAGGELVTREMHSHLMKAFNEGNAIPLNIGDEILKFYITEMIIPKL